MKSDMKKVETKVNELLNLNRQKDSKILLQDQSIENLKV